MPSTGRCLLCAADTSGGTICPACHDELPWLPAESCPICALPSIDYQVCGHCLRDRPAFDSTYATLAFAYPIDAVLRRFKYAGDLAIVRTLHDLMLPRLMQRHPLPQRLIPMPLHPERLKTRGFNQAAEISRQLARTMGIPLDLQACRRTRDTAPQAGLGPDDRKRNLRNAFACDADLRGVHVAILDDVMTTGTSLNELAKSVRKAGATRVDCWVAARRLKT